MMRNGYSCIDIGMIIQSSSLLKKVQRQLLNGFGKIFWYPALFSEIKPVRQN